MVTSTSLRESVLSIVRPEAHGELATRSVHHVQIVVSNEPLVHINDVRLQNLSVESIAQHIESNFPNYHTSQFVLGGDADARHSTVVMVLDALTELGIENVSILVRDVNPE